MKLRALAIVSAAYDGVLGFAMLLLARPMAELFGAPAPTPIVNAELNGVFALALSAGYVWAAQAPEARRGYLWVAGVFAKGLGAAVFIIDHFAHGSPVSFLLFAATDGTLALVTAALLLASTRRSGTPSAPLLR